MEYLDEVDENNNLIQKKIEEHSIMFFYYFKQFYKSQHILSCF